MTGPGATALTLNIPLLNRLRAAAGEFVPLEALGLDPASVRGDLDELDRFGFAIERHPYRGACYSGPAERLCPDQIEHGLATRRIGRRIAVWNRVTSTNDVAARAAGSVSNDGLVVLAEEQTAGRGRQGRSWAAPPRSAILMSVVIFPPRAIDAAGSDGRDDPAWLTALGAVATADVVADRIGRAAAIKWPNDVRVDGRKIAGILVERPAPASGAAVIGIGLNVSVDRSEFPPEILAASTSLRHECGGRPLDRSDIARELIRRLDRWYEAVRSNGCAALHAAWRDRNERLGQMVRVATPAGAHVGRLVDVDLRRGATLELGPEPADAAERAPERVRLADVLAITAATGRESRSGGPWTTGLAGS